jgi:peptide/nickel transport system substrate-binding protein
MRGSKWVGAAAVVAALAVITGCGSDGGASATGGSPARGQQEGDPKPGGTMTFALNAGWDTLDPAATAFTFSRQIMQFIYDPLLRHDPDSGEIVPGLAQSYDVSAGGREITLKLRPGVKFHDGTPCDADAVVFSLERIKDPELKSPWAATLLGPVKSVAAEGTDTVVIRLNKPYAPFLDALTQVNLAPVSPAAVKKEGEDFGAHPVGTGPFVFEKQVPNQSVTVKKNPDYNWAPEFYGRQGPAYVDAITVRNVPEDATRMALLQSGEIDMVYQAVAAQLKSYESNPEFEVKVAERSGMPRSMVMNTTKFPFDDPKVREAVAYAIDKEQLLKTAYGGVGTIAESILTPSLFGHSEQAAEAAPKYDPERAKQILADDGWTPGSDGILEKDGRKLSFTSLSQAATMQTLEAQTVQSALKKVGIDMKIQNVEQAAILEAMQRASATSIMGMLFAATDPDVMYTILSKQSIGTAWNAAEYSNPEMERLLEEGRTEMDPDKRAELYGEAQMLEARDLPYVPLQNVAVPFVAKATVHGLAFDRQGFWDAYTTWIG